MESRYPGICLQVDRPALYLRGALIRLHRWLRPSDSAALAIVAEAMTDNTVRTGFSAPGWRASDDHLVYRSPAETMAYVTTIKIRAAPETDDGIRWDVRLWLTDARGDEMEVWLSRAARHVLRVMADAKRKAMPEPTTTAAG